MLSLIESQKQRKKWRRNGFWVSHRRTLTLSYIDLRTLSSLYTYTSSSVCTNSKYGGGSSVPLLLFGSGILIVNLVGLTYSLRVSSGSQVVVILPLDDPFLLKHFVLSCILFFILFLRTYFIF